MQFNSVECPSGLFSELNKGLTQLLGDVVSEHSSATVPALTILEHKDRFVIECDLPGVCRDDIHIEVTEGILEISGERRQPELQDGSEVRLDERAWNSFCRRVRLHKSVDTAGIEADYRNGVLVVTAPVARESMRRSIEIRQA